MKPKTTAWAVSTTYSAAHMLNVTELLNTHMNKNKGYTEWVFINTWEQDNFVSHGLFCSHHVCVWVCVRGWSSHDLLSPACPPINPRPIHPLGVFTSLLWLGGGRRLTDFGSSHLVLAVTKGYFLMLTGCSQPFKTRWSGKQTWPHHWFRGGWGEETMVGQCQFLLTCQQHHCDK